MEVVSIFSLTNHAQVGKDYEESDSKELARITIGLSRGHIRLATNNCDTNQLVIHTLSWPEWDQKMTWRTDGSLNCG